MGRDSEEESYTGMWDAIGGTFEKLVDRGHGSIIILLVSIIGVFWLIDRHPTAIQNFIFTSTGEVKTAIWTALGSGVMMFMMSFNIRSEARRERERWKRLATKEHEKCQKELEKIKKQQVLMQNAFVRMAIAAGADQKTVLAIVDRLEHDMDRFRLRDSDEPRRGGKRQYDPGFDEEDEIEDRRR